MRSEIPGALLRTIPKRHKIAQVEVEYADDSGEGSADSKVRAMPMGSHRDTASKSRSSSWGGRPYTNQ